MFSIVRGHNQTIGVCGTETVFPILAHFLPRVVFEGTCKETQWRKVKRMQPMQLCIISGKIFEETFEEEKNKY